MTESYAMFLSHVCIAPSTDHCLCKWAVQLSEVYSYMILCYFPLAHFHSLHWTLCCAKRQIKANFEVQELCWPSWHGWAEEGLLSDWCQPRDWQGHRHSGMVTIKFRSESPSFKENFNQVSSVSLLMTSSTALANKGLFELIRWHGPSRCHSRKLPRSQVLVRWKS